MAADGTWQVDLCPQSQRIFQWKQGQSRGCPGQQAECIVFHAISINQVGQGRGIQAPLCQCRRQLFDFTQACAPAQVTSPQPAAQRRQIMGGRHGHGIAAPALGRQEARRITGERQDIHTEHAARRQLLADTCRNHAQILADHHALVPPGFQHQQVQQVLQRKLQIDPVARGRALR